MKEALYARRRIMEQQQLQQTVQLHIITKKGKHCKCLNYKIQTMTVK